MSLDGIVVRSIVHELESCEGGRINKIQQPTEHDIVLQIRTQGAAKRLLLSANPTYPRVHFTDEPFVNPMDAPMFCMLMRKHCESGIIEGVEQDGMERIIRLHVRQRDELGDTSLKTIIIELMGRHSNIVLIDPGTGTILDGIHHVTPAISSFRVVMPGTAYVNPPEQGKRNPLQTDKASFQQLLEAVDSGLPNEQRLVSAFTGISPLVAKEVVHRAANAGTETFSDDRLWFAFSAVMHDVSRHRYAPNVKTDDRAKRSVFSVIELTHVTGETETYASPSACLEAYYADKARRDTVKQRTSDLQRFLQNEIAKNAKKKIKLEETLQDAREADRFRIVGELLTASLHLINKGETKVEVVNYYDEEQAMISIELDPLLSPSENAQRYFKKYNKAKSSLRVVQEQLLEAEEENRYFETVQLQLQDAQPADIEEIREELAAGGYIRNRAKKGAKKKKPDKPNVAGYVSSEGFPIYVGKNNTQNDFVTFRVGQPGDTWLHTKDIPGSHVVIRGTGFGEHTLHEAAQLAGWFSQGRASSGVPVDYTLIRHVRKPSGSKPGFVIYDHQKTLYVTPDEQLIKRLTKDK